MIGRWQNGALVALRFFAMKCRNHMISGENQQKMTGKSVERAEIGAEMRIFLNSAQKFAERNFSQNAERRRTGGGGSQEPGGEFVLVFDYQAIWFSILC